MIHNHTNGLTIRCVGSLLDFSIPRVMGIVNVTPDSFYAGSRTYTPVALDQRVRQLMADGADIVDVGGYSTRPGAQDVDAEEEYRRVARGLETVRRIWPDAVVSVDTFRASVARRAVQDWGVSIINDVSGGTLDKDMWPTVAGMGVAYVLMHMRGTPETMQKYCNYENVTADVLRELLFKADELHQMGVADVILDPGFGFAKTVEQNFELLAGFDSICATGYPVLAGMSHKSMIWKTLGVTPAEAADGTIALDTVALLKGASILRVHDVKAAVQTVKLLNKLSGGECSGADKVDEKGGIL